MAHNAAPAAGAQADSVAHQIWQQQYDRYYRYWMSGYVPQVPGQNPYAQQSIAMYPHPTYDQNRSTQPNAHGAQYGGGPSLSYPAQAAHTQQVPRLKCRFGD
jgi:hypothetical protein